MRENCVGNDTEEVVQLVKNRELKKQKEVLSSAKIENEKGRRRYFERQKQAKKVGCRRSLLLDASMLATGVHVRMRLEIIAFGVREVATLPSTRSTARKKDDGLAAAAAAAAWWRQLVHKVKKARGLEYTEKEKARGW